MTKAINIAFGIGIAILIYFVVTLGISTFYPAPDYKVCSYDSACMKDYKTVLFLLGNIIGIAAVVVSLFLFSMMNISAGVAFGGLSLIVYGFVSAGTSVGDPLKFIVGLFVLVLLVIFAVLVNKRNSI